VEWNCAWSLTVMPERTMTLITGYSLHHNYHHHYHHCQISWKFKKDFNKIQCSNEASSGVGTMSFYMNKGNVIYIGPCLILIVENKRPTCCHLLFLFHVLCAQHVSDINISVIRNLWLFCWITTLVVCSVKYGGFSISALRCFFLLCDCQATNKTYHAHENIKITKQKTP